MKDVTLSRKDRIIKIIQHRDTRENVQYYCMMLLPMVAIFIFSYLPMFGIIIAFQDYGAGKPFFGEGVDWVGLKWFKQFVTSYYFPRILRNTLVLSLMSLSMGFFVPVLFALLLNEVRISKFKKFAQTCSYLPHFLSAVVIAGMVLSFIDSDGIITRFLQALGMEAEGLNINKQAFPWIYTITGIWSSFGWGSILYLSTISAIDPGLYEAAAIDGAGRFKRIWHITLPELAPLITINLIRSIGGLLGSNSGLILLLYNGAVYETADVIGTYTYRESLLRGDYSYGTACGLLMSIFSFMLVYISNATSRKFTDYSMW